MKLREKDFLEDMLTWAKLIIAGATLETAAKHRKYIVQHDFFI